MRSGSVEAETESSATPADCLTLGEQAHGCGKPDAKSAAAAGNGHRAVAIATMHSI